MIGQSNNFGLVVLRHSVENCSIFWRPISGFQHWSYNYCTFAWTNNIWNNQIGKAKINVCIFSYSFVVLLICELLSREFGEICTSAMFVATKWYKNHSTIELLTCLKIAIVFGKMLYFQKKSVNPRIRTKIFKQITVNDLINAHSQINAPYLINAPLEEWSLY